MMRLPRVWTAIGAVATALLVAAPPTAAAAALADTTPPTAPANLRVVVENTDFTWLSMTWDRSSDASGPITYHLDRHLGGDTWVEHGYTTNNLITIEIGRPGTGGTYRIRATDPSNNVSAPSNELTATTLPDKTSPAMRTVNLLDAAPVSVKLSWPRGTDNFRVSHYRVLLDDVQVATTSTLTYKVRNLKPGNTYTFTVVAVDYSGNVSTPSNAVVVTTPTTTDTAPPSVPGNLFDFGPLGPGCMAELQWDPSTDNVDPSSALDYEVIFEDRTLALVEGRLDALVAPNDFAPSIDLSVRAIDRSGNVSDVATVKHPCE